MRINDALGSKYIFCDESFRNQMNFVVEHWQFVIIQIH